MENGERSIPFSSQNVTVNKYEAEHILIGAKTTQNALLVLGEKFYEGWKVTIDGNQMRYILLTMFCAGSILRLATIKWN